MTRSEVCEAEMIAFREMRFKMMSLSFILNRFSSFTPFHLQVNTWIGDIFFSPLSYQGLCRVIQNFTAVLFVALEIKTHTKNEPKLTLSIEIAKQSE